MTTAQHPKTETCYQAPYQPDPEDPLLPDLPLLHPPQEGGGPQAGGEDQSPEEDEPLLPDLPDDPAHGSLTHPSPDADEPHPLPLFPVDVTHPCDK